MQENKQNKPQSSSPFPKMEEEVLEFWDKGKIFEKSVKNPPHPSTTSPQPSPCEGERVKVNDYVFYDGPPFATGDPHYGHIVASLMKDAVPRYWTMKGYRVERKWGWDCHGLPIENIAEKDLGVEKKKDIEEMGVDKFNEYCRSKVLGYVDVWKKVIRRLGRWADMENSYKTMDLPFMESVWWVFKQLFDKGLIYEGYRSMHICTRCETTLSQSEVAEGYKMIKDLSAIAKFEILTPDPSPSQERGAKTFVLAWTTTPWTLIGNVALAVNKSIKYQVLSIKGNTEKYILAKDRVGDVFKDKEYEVVGEIEGEKLVGKSYKPLFDYYSSQRQSASSPQESAILENGWKIYPGDFVTTEDGTGVVHIAPAFGEDDMNLGKQFNLPFVQHVKIDGTIKDEVKDFAGMNVKQKNDHMKTDVEIIKYLAHNGLLFHKEKYEHSYPHCWRCDTPLINYATTSWFVKVTDIKEKALSNAQSINWSPAHIKEGRFGMWMAGARDWSISRQRYWASAMPIWKCGGKTPLTPLSKGGEEQNVPLRKGDKGGFDCEEMKVFGSVKELEDVSGEKVTDLHKHIVDKITFKCEKCGGEMHRIPDVLDTWFDSGSMPYAQMHYPFENKEKFEENFPAEFIAEGQDQCRAWFYYLHVIATGVMEKPAFRNVIVNGIVLAEDGKKMSKRLKNYPDPTLMFDKYGADAMRYYLLSSPVMSAENLNFSEKGVLEALQKNIMILWNVYKFYEMFASPFPKGGQGDFAPSPSQGEGRGEVENVLDQWIVARLNQLIEEVTKSMDGYDLPRSVRPITEFINDLSTWYIRRSRDRFKDVETHGYASLQTTRFILLELAKIMAPFMPFIAETIWQKVTGHDFKDENESVHLTQWPVSSDTEHGTHNILDEMEIVRKIVELGLAKRDEAGIKVRQPLSQLRITNYELRDEFEDLVKDELNVKDVKSEKANGEISVELDTEITPELKLEGIKREIVRFVNNMRKDAGLSLDDRAEIFYATDSDLIREAIETYTGELMKDTLSEAIKFASDAEGLKEAKIDGDVLRLGIKKK